MRYSKEGLELTQRFEACRLTAYQKKVGGKTDVPTIGWGHTKGVKLGDACTQEQADRWLLEDVAWAEAEVNNRVRTKLSQHQFDALVDFVFNCGCGNFEHSTLFRLLNEGNLSAAAEEFEKWKFAGGKEVAGLLRRRLAEKAEFKEA